MVESKPKHIVCAVRGGPESRDTVTYAIDLALKSGASLTFLRVMDAEFLEHATVGPLSVVYSELQEMGQFALLILCDRAQRRGVAKVDCVVREGNIRKQLRLFAIETHAQVMVMGRPTRSPGRNVFKPGEIDAFAAELGQEANLHIQLVPPSSDVGSSG
jgi:nucleotide-binding universal stress UspA family protein